MKKNLLFMLALLVSLSMVFVSCDNDNDNDDTIDYAKKVAGTYKGTVNITTKQGDNETTEEPEELSVIVEQKDDMIVKITIPSDDDEQYIFENCTVDEDGSLTTMRPIIIGNAITSWDKGKVADKKLTFTLTTTVSAPVKATITTEFEGTLVE